MIPIEPNSQNNPSHRIHRPVRPILRITNQPGPINRGRLASARLKGRNRQQPAATKKRSETGHLPLDTMFVARPPDPPGFGLLNQRLIAGPRSLRRTSVRYLPIEQSDNGLDEPWPA
jgi:hypothetical protein